MDIKYPMNFGLRIEPLIPQHINSHPRGGRKRIADRTVFNAILFVARTGCQWKALDATGICSGSTAHLRFQEWTQGSDVEEYTDPTIDATALSSAAFMFGCGLCG
jgi:hypothetical protein